MPPRELEASLTSAEIGEFMALDNIEPIGEQREDIRHARLLALIAAMAGGSATSPIDWMPFSVEPEPTQEELVDKWRAYIGACG